MGLNVNILIGLSLEQVNIIFLPSFPGLALQTGLLTFILCQIFNLPKNLATLLRTPAIKRAFSWQPWKQVKYCFLFSFSC